MDSGLRLVSFASPAWSPELVFATSLCQSAGRYPPPHGISFDSFLPLRLRLRLRCRVRSSIVGVSTPLFFTIRARQHLTIGLATVATHDRPQCSAAVASIVEASTPILSPFTRPRSATSFKTNSNTFS